MLVLEAKDLGYIPKPWHTVFPDVCPTCGEHLCISDNLKTLYCDNPFCGRKEDMRLYNILHNLGVKGVGPAIASNLMNCLYRYHELVHDETSNIHDDVIAQLPKAIVSPLEVFYLPIGFYPVNSSYMVNKERWESIQNALHREYDYAELISKMAFPNFGKTAYTVFDGCSSFRDYLKLTNNLEDSSPRILLKLGYGSNALNAINILKMYLQDFMLIDKLFHCRTLTDLELDLDIVITGSITEYGSYAREEFVNYINNKFNGRVRVRVGKAHATADYVIADRPSSSKSYLSAKQRQSLLNREYLVTSRRFMEIIEERIESKNV